MGRIDLRPDGLTEHGITLFLDGAEQSHVDPEDPNFLLHDYTLRLAAAVETLVPQTAPRALHLGAGALTLPRWIAHHRPDADQTAVDWEPELMGLVLEKLPMTPPPRQVIADASQVLDAETGGELAGETFDVVIADLFNSAAAPEALTSPEFFAAMLAATPEGVLLMNLGDDPPMDFARAVTATLLEALPSAEHLALSAPADVVAGAAEGNLVLIATPARRLPESARDALWARGPHPGEILHGEELAGWAGGHSGSASQI